MQALSLNLRSWLSGAFALVLALCACAQGDSEERNLLYNLPDSGDAEASASDAACACSPPQTVPCECPSGQTGWKSCASDCLSYLSCQGCEPPDAAPEVVPDSPEDSDSEASDAPSEDAAVCTNPAPQSHCPGATLSLTGSGTSPRTGSVTGTTEGSCSLESGSCGPSGTQASPEAIYAITPDIDGTLRLDLQGSAATPFDSVLYVRKVCNLSGQEIACVDSYDPGSETLSLQVAQGQPYYVFVDGYQTASGPFTLHAQLIPPGCGDGILQPGEPCDDGNLIAQDGCSPQCTIEDHPAIDTCPGLALTLSDAGSGERRGALHSDTTYLHNDFTAQCAFGQTDNDAVVAITAEFDGTLELYLGGASVTDYDSILSVRTQCDAPSSEVICANTATPGGESTRFPVLAGQTYYALVDAVMDDHGPFTLTATLRPARCGNAFPEGSEQCDDGNTNDGDGCSHDCRRESQGPGDLCPGLELTMVGSGSQWVGTAAGDTTSLSGSYTGSCTNSLLAHDVVYQFNSQSGGKVTVTLTSLDPPFAPVLYVRGGACEGPLSSELGCQSSPSMGTETLQFVAPANTTYWAFIDASYSSTGRYRLEVSIAPACGDAVIDAQEQCDDGNRTAGDGCSPDCQLEPACAGGQDTEPNDYNRPQAIPASCGTYQIHGALTPLGDADHYQLSLVDGAILSVGASLQGQCPQGSSLVLSLWNAPMSAQPNAGGCAISSGYVICSDSSDQSPFCSTLRHEVSSGEEGPYILKIHNWSTAAPINAYTLLLSVQ